MFLVIWMLLSGKISIFWMPPLKSLFVEISIPKAKNIIVGVIYKAPSIDHGEFMATLQNVCSHITRSNKPYVISGAFNINLLNYMYARSSSQSFIDLLTSH